MPGRVVDLVDTLGSGSSARMSLGVRVPPRRPSPRLHSPVRSDIPRRPARGWGLAEFDDERPPGDDRSAEPPETGTAGLRRFPPRERGDRYGDEEGTGEVPRPRDPPPDDDFGFGDLHDEP